MRMLGSQNKSGMTLIEVIISLAIFSIVMFIIMSVFSFQLKAFAMSSDSKDEQASLRLVSYKLTDKLRNVSYINLIDRTSVPVNVSDLGNAEQCFVLEADGVKNGIKNGLTVDERSFSDNKIKKLEFSFDTVTDPYNPGRIKSKLLITINRGSINQFSTEVLLNNIIVNFPHFTYSKQ